MKYTLIEAKNNIDNLIAQHGDDRECLLWVRPTPVENAAKEAAAEAYYAANPDAIRPIRGFQIAAGTITSASLGGSN